MACHLCFHKRNTIRSLESRVFTRWLCYEPENQVKKKKKKWRIGLYKNKKKIYRKEIKSNT